MVLSHRMALVSKEQEIVKCKSVTLCRSRFGLVCKKGGPNCEGLTQP